MEDTHSDVWRLDLAQVLKLFATAVAPSQTFWQMVESRGTPPGRISGHCAVAIETMIYVYGGQINGDNQDRCLFTFNTIDGTWTRITALVTKLRDEV